MGVKAEWVRGEEMESQGNCGKPLQMSALLNWRAPWWALVFLLCFYSLQFHSEHLLPTVHALSIRRRSKVLPVWVCRFHLAVKGNMHKRCCVTVCVHVWSQNHPNKGDRRRKRLAVSSQHAQVPEVVTRWWVATDGLVVGENSKPQALI